MLIIIIIALIHAPRFCNDIFPLISDTNNLCLLFECSLSDQGLTNSFHTLNKFSLDFLVFSHIFFYFFSSLIIWFSYDFLSVLLDVN